MEAIKDYVWFNVKTGRFSQNFGGNEQSILNLMEKYKFDESMSHWKLIKYTCLNDPNFQLESSKKE